METAMKKWTFCLLLPFLLAGCGSPAQLESCRSTADIFMERLAKGDFNGAYELCDPDSLTLDNLRTIANNPKFDAVMSDYKGFSHGDGGQKEERGDVLEIRLAPAQFKGHEGYVAHFAFRHHPGTWKLIAFKIDTPQ
jgi:hypothetical protein